MPGAARLVFLVSVMLLALVVAPGAGADLGDERALAEKYAPIVRIVEQQDVCGYGEPFIPTDIDLLLGEETVALRGPCDYNRWARRLTQDSEPVVYAHVVGESSELALQYWFFYPFNDFNNTHEGDWEMIQLVFDVVDADAALATRPVEAGYSSHEGAERASWDDDKLEVVDERPVVYPAAGSHANKYSDALWLGSSAEAGVGCDDTRGPQ